MKPISAKQITVEITNIDDREAFKIPAGFNGYTVKNGVHFLIRGDQPINLKNGMVSFASKFNLSEAPTRLIMKPDDFFGMIDPSKIDTSMVEVYGTFTKEMIKCKVKEVMTKRKNASQTKALLETGAVKAVKDGHFSVNDLSRVQQGEEIIREADEAAKKLELDVPRGEYVEFFVYTKNKKTETGKDEGQKTGSETKKRVRIVSCLNDGAKLDPIVRERTADGNGFSLDNEIKRNLFVKRKHYYFYSENSGYGKSTVLASLESSYNCSAIQDFNNLAGVRENSQFLVYDEFSYASKITVDQLKALTGGKPNSFAGNKKSFGRGFKPRKDVQLIMASNRHLFECVGSKYDPATRTRSMHHLTAKQLFDRFHIIKFDDETVKELEHGAACLAVDDGRYEDFFEDDDADLEEFVIANRELVERFIRLIKNKGVYRNKKGKKRKNMDDDDEEGEDLEPDGEYLGLSEFDSRGRPLNKPLYRRFLNNLARRWSWKDEK